MFIIQQTENVQDAVYLNKGLLRCVVESYYADIHRYKDFSGTLWASYHKQAAYTIKWVVRFKPIQIREEYDNENDLIAEIVDINLTFALACGFFFLKEEERELIFNEVYQLNSKNQENPEKSFYDKLLYNLRYRHFTGKHLTAIFEALEISSKKNA